MKFFDTLKQFWKELSDRTEPFRNFMKKVGSTLSSAWAQVYQFRDLILAVPVVIGSIWLACINLSELPETVGINLQADGTYAGTMSRGVAVLVPLIITVLCLLLMIASKRKLYPWMICMLSLLLPLLIMVTNVYPA